MIIADEKDLSVSTTNLEMEIQSLKRQIDGLKSQIASLESSRYTGYRPDTALLSDNFLTRAFTVWGHYFVAQLIISSPFIVCGILGGL